MSSVQHLLCDFWQILCDFWQSRLFFRGFTRSPRLGVVGRPHQEAILYRLSIGLPNAVDVSVKLCDEVTDCPERARLRARCTDTMRVYADALVELRGLPQSCTPEYRKARSIRNEAHAEFDSARLALDKHEHLHHY
jgi:hypothetical protein